MLFKGFFTRFGYRICSILFSADKSFFNFYTGTVFQCFYMTGQVAVCYLYQFFQFIKIHLTIYKQRTHDAQPNPAVKYLI